MLPNFGKSGTTDQAFMGVFDGHGRDGHHCARYVRDNVRNRASFVFLTLSTGTVTHDCHVPVQLPNNILDSIERISAPSVKSADIKSALREAHLLTNEKVRSHCPHT